MVFYWIVIFTGLRAAVMDYLLVPLARRAGIGRKKETVRFAEQAWIFTYYGVFWSLGMVCSLSLRVMMRLGGDAKSGDSISCIIPTIGWTSGSSGLAGPIEK